MTDDSFEAESPEIFSVDADAERRNSFDSQTDRMIQWVFDDVVDPSGVQDGHVSKAPSGAGASSTTEKQARQKQQGNGSSAKQPLKEIEILRIFTKEKDGKEKDVDISAGLTIIKPKINSRAEVKMKQNPIGKLSLYWKQMKKNQLIWCGGKNKEDCKAVFEPTTRGKDKYTLNLPFSSRDRADHYCLHLDDGESPRNLKFKYEKYEKNELFEYLSTKADAYPSKKRKREEKEEVINAVKDNELPTLKKLNFSTSELKDCSDTLKVKLEPHTLIHLAAKYNSVDVLEYFVKKKIFKVDELVKNQSTPLHQAAHHGKLQVLEKLICLESNPWLRTKSDYLPIHNAILRNQDKVVEILLNYMSKKNPSKKEITFERIRVPPSKHWKNEHTEKLKGFIEKVFSPNAVSQK